MAQEFITSKGKVIKERDVLFIRNLTFYFRDTILTELFVFIGLVILFLIRIFETEKTNADYFGIIMIAIIALFNGEKFCDILMKRSLSNRIPFKRITSFEIKPDEIGLEIFVILHLKSGRYKKIALRSLEKQYEPFTELLSQHIIQPQLPDTINILMTGAGAPGAAGIIRCLQQNWINLTVADADNMAIGKFLNKDFVQIPKATEDNFISSLLDLCKSKSIQIILPLVTKELLPLATSKPIFEKAGIKVLVSSKEGMEIANDKAACYQYLAKRKISVPAFGIVNSVNEFIKTASDLGYPEIPFCFKPSHSNGSRGFRIINDAVDEWDQLFNQKPYNTFITYANALRILSSKTFPQLLVTEYLPGDEYSVDCLTQQGVTKLIVPRVRKKMINGISVQGEFINDEAIINYCKKIIEAIGLHGNIGIQVKKRSNGEPLLLEINPRVQGTIVAGLGAGINLPLLAIKQEMDMPIDAAEMQPVWGTSFTRHWSEIYH